MYFVAYGQFLVIGGFGRKQTEVIDLTDSSLKCTSAFGELESQRIRAMGGIINETPVICGGYKKYKNEGDEDFNYEDHDCMYVCMCIFEYMYKRKDINESFNR